MSRRRALSEVLSELPLLQLWPSDACTEAHCGDAYGVLGGVALRFRAPPQAGSFGSKKSREWTLQACINVAWPKKRRRREAPSE